MPNLKSISFRMAVLQGGRQNLPSPCVGYPKDPMWNRAKLLSMMIIFVNRDPRKVFHLPKIPCDHFCVEEKFYGKKHLICSLRVVI